MKKLMFAAAAIAAGVAMADVQSANVVGYQTQSLASDNYTMFSVPFKHVNNDGKGLMLNSDLKIANPTMTDSSGSADQIWVWVPANNGYDKFYFYTGEYGTGWCEMQSGNEEFFEDDPVYGVTGIPSGAAMYYKAKTGAGKSMTFKSPLK